MISELQPGDCIRITGYLGLPRIAGHPIWLHVTTLQLLDTAPPRLTDTTEDTRAAAGPGEDDTADPVTATLSDHGQMKRYGPYLVYTDPDLCADSIWTETGEWVGAAVYPTTATDLINAHRAAAGDA